MAHGATYAGGHTDGAEVAVDDDGIDRTAMLEHNGYNPEPRLIQGANGMQMVVYTPSDPTSGVQPVVSFRGTEPGERADIDTDFDLAQVGNSQYEANQELIDETMRATAEEFGSVEVTGHSLGGALAQIAAARNLESTEHITTFQAPGVTGDNVERIEEYNRQRVANGEAPIEADHFQVDGCVVSPTGVARAPGQNHDITLASPLDDLETPNSIARAAIPGLAMVEDAAEAVTDTVGLARTDPFSAHTAMPLTALALQTPEGREALGHDPDADPEGQIPVPDHPVFGTPLEVRNVRTSDVDNSEVRMNEHIRREGGRGARFAARQGDAMLAMADDRVDLGQAIVDDQVGGAQSNVDFGQAMVQNTVLNGQSMVDDQQRRVHDNVDFGQNVTDVIQDRVLGHSAIAAPANTLIDMGQSGVNQVVDSGQQLVDSGQIMANSVVAGGQQMVNSGQRSVAHTVAEGQRMVDRGQHAAHEVWDWITE